LTVLFQGNYLKTRLLPKEIFKEPRIKVAMVNPGGWGLGEGGWSDLLNLGEGPRGHPPLCTEIFLETLISIK